MTQLQHVLALKLVRQSAALHHQRGVPARSLRQPRIHRQRRQTVIGPLLIDQLTICFSPVASNCCAHNAENPARRHAASSKSPVRQ